MKILMINKHGLKKFQIYVKIWNNKITKRKIKNKLLFKNMEKHYKKEKLNQKKL